jgi:DNA-binding transcriptional LysR family regulator
MELQRLRYFVSVAECLSFSAAARRMHLTVPTLSRQIFKLEEELEVQLLARNRRQVSLTPAGELLLREASNLLSQSDKIEHSVRLAHKGDAGSVRIGFATGLAPSIGPILVEHGRMFPTVELQCTEMVSEAQEEALRQRKIDVGFLRLPLDTDKVRSEPLFEERLVVLVHQDNPLAQRRPKSLRLKDLMDQPLLLHERDSASALYDKIVELLRQSGLTPQIVHQGPITHYPLMVATGKGVAIGAGMVHALFEPPVVAIPLAEGGSKLPVHLAWRKEETAASVRAFLNSARRVFPRKDSPERN